MTSTPLPPHADQTRALLWIQLVLNMAGILVLTFVVVQFAPVQPDPTWVGHVYTVVGGLFFGGLLSAAAAKMFPRGWAFGWIVALLAQLLVVGAVWVSWQLGLAVGAGVLVALGAVAWICVNLFRTEVRRHFFAAV